jgi:hypothetical protein
MAMAWVKNINGIDQQQAVEHKREYQSPDYSLLVEDSHRNRFNVLIDVKSVNGGKESCEIPIKQKHSLMNYARDHRAPILLAIYWDKLGCWTHNVISQLGGKKRNKITWQDALKNDLSHIFGDYTFFVTKPFYRRTFFTQKKDATYAEHSDYGYFSSILVGKSMDNLIEYSVIDSSLIDSSFIGRKLEVTHDGESTILTEIFAETPMLVRTSSVLVNFLKTWEMDPSTAISETKVIEMGRKLLVELMKDLGYKPTYSIPSEKNDGTDRIFKLAYENTTVWNDYTNSKIVASRNDKA